jgi:hypothetical protein
MGWGLVSGLGWVRGEEGMGREGMEEMEAEAGDGIRGVEEE